MNSFMRGWFYSLGGLALLGCATSQAVGPMVHPSPGAESEVHMDPMMVVSKTDPLTGLDGFDAQQLMDLGNRLYGQNEFDRAAKIFDRLSGAFPEAELVPSAVYNAGLSLERLEEWDGALQHYQRVVQSYPRSSSFKDAMFRSSECYAKLLRWKEVADNYWSIRQTSGLNSLEELEARVGQGVGMFMQDDWATAEHEFQGALRFYEAHSKDEYLPADYFVGQARFYLGEIEARAFERVTWSVPEGQGKVWEEKIGAELEEKCARLLRAQTEFIQAIRAGHPGWASAAGYRIGSLYEHLYDDMMNAPVPQGLSAEAREYYRDQLKKRVGILISKAIQVYEQSLEMATRVGEKNEWVERASKSLERMKALSEAALKRE